MINNDIIKCRRKRNHSMMSWEDAETYGKITVIKRQMRYDGVRLVIDQHSDKDLHKLADRFGLHHAKDAMCGFVALAIAYFGDGDRKQLLQTLKFKVLSWVVKKRETYIQQHPDEFVAHGSSDHSGRMSREMYRSIMASTPELFQYISEHPIIPRTKQEQIQCRGNDGCNVAMLHNVLEGPPVNDVSIRFPRNPKIFVPQEEFEFLQHERQFWGFDHYVQVAFATAATETTTSTSTSTNDRPDNQNSQDKYQLLSLEEFCRLVIAQQKEWKIILDNHGHYHVLQLSFEINGKGNNSCDDGDVSIAHTSNSSSKTIETIILKELESLKRTNEDSTPQVLQNFMNCLQSTWVVEQ